MCRLFRFDRLSVTIPFSRFSFARFPILQFGATFFSPKFSSLAFSVALKHHRHHRRCRRHCSHRHYRSIKQTIYYRLIIMREHCSPSIPLLLAHNLTKFHKTTTRLHRFQDIADSRSNCRCRQGMPLFSALVRGEPLNSGLQNLV